MDVFFTLSPLRVVCNKVVEAKAGNSRVLGYIVTNSWKLQSTTVCDLEPKVHRRYIDSQAPPWGVLCMPSSPVLTVLRRKVANRSLGALSCPGRSHNPGLTKRPKRLVSYIYNLPCPVNYLSWKTDFVLFYFSSSLLSQVKWQCLQPNLAELRARRSARSWAMPET